MAENRRLRVDLAADMRRRCGLTADAEADETDGPLLITGNESRRITVRDRSMGAMHEALATARLRVDLASDMRRRLAERQWPPVEDE